MSNAADSRSLFIGLMSGTSMDGIDAALVEFGDHRCNVVAASTVNYPEELRHQLLRASRDPEKCSVDLVGRLDHWVGECFRDAALQLISDSEAGSESVLAIGSHGQTLRHQPRASRPFTLQIGDANVIASGTGITTIADFRRRDVAVGGEGAPLAPAFHHWLFGNDAECPAVLNIGGIANLTVLNPTVNQITGFDTGPGNSLLDGWIRNQRGMQFDKDGRWASTGNVNQLLLEEMLLDPYFDLDPPKSTGFEYFNEHWVGSVVSRLDRTKTPAADVQASLAELTAKSVSNAVLKYAPNASKLLVCGGGVHNIDLMERLGRCLPDLSVESTERSGLHPDWVEAVAFAWLAKRRLEGKTGSVPSVTGAESPEVLGAIYSGRPLTAV